MVKHITAEEFFSLAEDVAQWPVPVYDPSVPLIDDDEWSSIVSAVDQMEVPRPPADTTPLDPHRPGRVSFYYFVGYVSPTVDGASKYRREESLDMAPIHRIALTYDQAKSLDLVR